MAADFCLHCGQKLENGAQFCLKCGRPTDLNATPSKAIPIPISLKSALTAFLLCLFISAIVWFLVSGLADIAQLELKAIRAGDYKTAYSYTSSEFQKNVSLKDFTHFVNDNPVLKDNVGASFPQREFKNNYGTVRGELYLQNGETTPLEIQLIKEDGAWKVIYINLKPGSSANQSLDSAPKPYKRKLYSSLS